jgi:hypothetical protein
MLDLEIADVTSHNHAILEIGAVYFDLDTGNILDQYTKIVNLNS